MTNRIFAGVVFLFSLIIYILTMAPTTSFWDCGEFIATSYTLGVPHPPGTPLYLLIGNVFSNIFFFIDDVGARVNLVSPIVSALSVMLVYLITVQLIKKWFNNRGNIFSEISIYCSALIGALLFAFTDAQWFNAVEAEVYGMSTFFTAIVVWLALQWTEKRGENGNIRYIILISYLMGLAIGVHLLNLLAIPFIGLIIYFSSSKDNIGGFLADNFLTYILGLITFIGLDILGLSTAGSLVVTFFIVMLSLLIRYLLTFLIFKSEFTFKILLKYLARISILPICGFIFYIINNGIIRGFPHMIKYWSGADRIELSFYENFTLFIFPLTLVIILIIGIIIYIILENLKKMSEFSIKSSLYNVFKVSVISLFMIYIGFSTYSMIFIRAGQNPNINENDPSDKASFVKYMNREQYGTEHHSIDWYNILKYYLSTDGKESEYNEEFDRILDDQNIQIDSSFSGLDSSDNKQRWLTYPYQNYVNPSTGSFDIKKVSNEDIVRFVKDYQISEMYLRYFAWQFIGKEYIKENYSWDRSDLFNNQRILPLQDNSNISNIDWFRYGLPFAFIFGIIGMIYHFIRDPKRALSILVLFLATGIAIVLYLNQYDPQPRERDYSYVGSFFAFSIWIGIGCMSLLDLAKYLFSKFNSSFERLNKIKILIPIISIALILMIVPMTYLVKDYSVHDRSGNFSARDYGYNILIGCKPNSIIFTNGDNDTFPLWYSQEVEKNRTDVRVINLSLLNASWYIKQLYNNNAPGTIGFDFNEPIISELEYQEIAQIIKRSPFPISVPIFINDGGDYYIDLNNDKKYSTYNQQKTLEIINNLEDPITATIYAYKRWDPITWAYIEASYLSYEIQLAIDKPESSNILRTIYKDNYDLVMAEIKQQKITDFEGKVSANLQLVKNIMDANQDGVIGPDEIQVADYLDRFVRTGNGAFEEDNLKMSRWGMTPDNINGSNYPYYYLEVPPLNSSIQYANKPINISNNPTIQGVAFRLQDVMILKIIEDLALENRSIYFATTVSPSSQMNLTDYFSNQGMVLELNQDISTNDEIDILYKNLTERYNFRNLDNLNVYYSPDNKRILQNYRILFLTLAALKPDTNIMKHMNKVMPDNVIEYDPNRPSIKFWAARNYLQAGMDKDWFRLITELLKDRKVDLSLDLEIAAHLYQLNKLNDEPSINLNEKVQTILKKRNKEINNLIAQTKSDDYSNLEIINQFYKDLIYNLQIIDFLTLLDDFDRSTLLTGALFEVHYKQTYNSDTNISDFIKSIESKVEINLDRTMSEEKIKVAINELIIEEIYSFSIKYDDDYVQNFIAMLRDALVQKYK